MTRRRASVAFIALLAGCVQQQASIPPAPQGVKQIVVPKPANRTQSSLVVDDPGWLDKMLSADKKKTVSGVLASHLRDQLERQFEGEVGNVHRTASQMYCGTIAASTIDD